MHKKAQRARLGLVFFFYLLILFIISFRLLNIQILNNRYFIKLAESQHYLTKNLLPQRGNIYDRNLKILALSLKLFSVYAVPRQIEDKIGTAKQLASVLNLDEQLVLERLTRDKLFVWIKRNIEEKDINKIRQLKLKGVDFFKESKRYYPNGELACHVLGFAGIDEEGLDGVELYYDNYLKGKIGRRSLLRDAKQRELPAFEYEYIPVIDGYNLVLTIDEVIQHIVEQELDEAIEKNNAKAASIVVMDPYTGEIYALANHPHYNLNYFGKSLPEERRNRAISDFFEPGSTFKIVTACAALEEGRVSLNDKFFCENGNYKIAGHILHDHQPHGWLTFVEVVEKSSNIGVVKVAQTLGGNLIYNYIQKFSFGKPTGIDLPGETAGFVRQFSQWSKLSISAIPIGQEVCVSSLQMARAIAVIANGGFLVEPRLCQKIIDNKGEIIQEFKPPSVSVQQTISSQTAQTMKQILKGVVDKGTGRSASIEGYEVAGKTGTAQKVEPTGGYSHQRFVASFIGFAPVENPRFVIVVIFDEPRPVYYGGVVSAPVFKKIAENMLKYMDVPKTKTLISKKLPNTEND